LLHLFSFGAMYGPIQFNHEFLLPTVIILGAPEVEVVKAAKPFTRQRNTSSSTGKYSSRKRHAYAYRLVATYSTVLQLVRCRGRNIGTSSRLHPVLRPSCQLPRYFPLTAARIGNRPRAWRQGQARQKHARLPAARVDLSHAGARSAAAALLCFLAPQQQQQR
jgi:hypothetical protein